MLSNRCLTFKGTNLEYQLIHQYYSPTILKSGLISKSLNLDAKQTSSIIAGDKHDLSSKEKSKIN